MIELQDVHKTYDTGTIALNGISMKIDDGEFVFLVGPSGSGKSTIIKILTAELRPTSGSALVNGFAVEKLRSRAVPYLRRTLGVIFQDFRLIGDKSVYENVAFAMRVIGAPEKEIQKRVPYVLELVGLETKGRRLPNELSGGELVCTCEASPHNLVDILDTLRAADVALGRVWSEPPTLNDVFLEITGRELRD